MQHEYAPLVEELIRLLREEFGNRVRSVLLFGSVARGTARPDSDVDLCIVIRDLPVSRYRRHQLLSPLLERLRQSEAYKTLIGHGYAPEDRKSTRLNSSHQ